MSVSGQSASGGRIAYLDSFRGIALLLIVGFHSFARWPELYPYGGRYARVALFDGGGAGVGLFFAISGYVILMTLEKCTGIKEFLYRRWLRLFPGMLICSAIIYSTAGYFRERPAGAPVIWSLLPGLTFVDSVWWLRIFGFRAPPLEGSFWTLYLEFRFYVFSGVVFYLTSAKNLVLALFGVFFGSEILLNVHSMMPNSLVLNEVLKLIEWFTFQKFGWFTAGAAYYLYDKTKLRKWLYFAFLVSLLSAALVEADLATKLGATLVSILFFAAVVSTRVQKILCNGFLLKLGFVSYPLYLLHENILVASIVKIGNYWPSIPPFLIPLIPFSILFMAAYLIATYAEPALRQVLKKWISMILQRFEPNTV